MIFEDFFDGDSCPNAVFKILDFDCHHSGLGFDRFCQDQFEVLPVLTFLYSFYALLFKLYGWAMLMGCLPFEFLWEFSEDCASWL